MKQREIYEVFFDPVRGSEQGGRRPALVISGNLVNSKINTIIIMPLTTKLKNYQGNLILKPNTENGLSLPSEVMAIHIRSISKDRLQKRLGIISISDFEIVKDGLTKIIKF